MGKELTWRIMETRIRKISSLGRSSKIRARKGDWRNEKTWIREALKVKLNSIDEFRGILKNRPVT